MDHSKAKRYAISMVLLRIERDMVSMKTTLFPHPGFNSDDKDKIEGCLKDIHESLSSLRLTADDHKELGGKSLWLR